jgi:hypothetical protein
MLFYPAALPLSRQTLDYTAGIIRRHRRKIGSCWRKLNPGRQALLVLAYLRKGETFAELAAGFGIGTATAWRYVTETVALLAARAPKLRRALRDASKAGHAYLVTDGTLIPIDRVAADRPFYSGKHRRNGMNLQVIAGPDGEILWVSGPLPGAVHDLTAARIWGIIAELAASGLIVLGDKGYLGEDCIRTPYRGRNMPASQKEANRAHARLRAPGERANARLKSWRILRKLRCCLARRSAGQGHPRPADPRNRRMRTLSLSALASVAVQEVAQCAAGGNQRGGHQVDGHPGDAGEVARLVLDAGAGDGQGGEERHPGGRGQQRGGGHGRVVVTCLLAGPPQQPQRKELGPGHCSPSGGVMEPGVRRPGRVEHVGGVQIGPPGADDRADRRAAEDQTADSHAPACLSGRSRWAASPAVRRMRVADRAAWRRDSSRGSSGSARMAIR